MRTTKFEFRDPASDATWNVIEEISAGNDSACLEDSELRMLFNALLEYYGYEREDGEG